MGYVGRLEQYIFYCMCGFALTVSLNSAYCDAFTGIALFLGLAVLMKKRIVISNHEVKRYLNILLIFFAVYFIFIFLSDSIAISAKAYWRYFNRMFPFMIVLLFIRDRNKLFVLFFCALFSLFFNNIYSIYEGIQVILSGSTNVRTFGIGKDVIALAGFLLIFLPIMFLLFLNEKARSIKYLYFILFIIGIAALILNGTRIAWLVMVLLLPLSIFLYGKNVKKFGFGLIGLYILIALVGYQIPVIHDRMESIVDKTHGSNQGHYLINKSALQMVGDKPILGHGLGFFPKVFNESYIAPQTKQVEKHITHAHNDTLTIWAETGIVGVAVFWLMFGSFLFFSLRSWKRTRQIEDLAFFVVTLAAVLHGITDTRFGMHQVAKMYFFLMAVYLNYRYTCKKNELI